MSSSAAEAEAGEGEEAEKQYFPSERPFLYICVCFAVSYQTLVLFPLLVLKHGGVCFLVPYTVILVTVGVPMVALEFLVGQFRGKGCLEVWTCVPVGKGVGMAMLLKTFVVAIYQVILDSYVFYYFLQAFQRELPWTRCFPWWGANVLNCAVTNITVTRFCNAERHRLYDSNVGKDFSLSKNTTVIEVCGKKLKISAEAYYNGTSHLCTRKEHGSELSYFLNGMLKISTGIDDFGGIRWQLLVCYLFSWFFIFVCTSSGVPTVGKVAPGLAAVPFVALVLLATQMMFLPDGRESVLELLTPRWQHLRTVEAWSDATYYILNGFNIGMGKLYCLASYNSFDSTAIYSCLVFLGGCGTLARYLGQCVQDFPSHPLVFPYYIVPQLVVHLPLSNLWTGVFFMALYLMSIDEAMGNVGTVVTCAEDLFPSIRVNMSQAVFMVCISICLAGLPMITQAGPYVLELLQEHAVSAILSHFTAMAEVCLFAWLYGLKRFTYDVQFMLGYKPNVYFRFCWLVICPSVLAAFYLHRVSNFVPHRFFDYDFPQEYEALAWIIGGVALLQVPIGACAAILQNIEVPGRAFLPEAQWIPNYPERVDGYFEELEELGIEGESSSQLEAPQVLNEDTFELEISVDPDAPLYFNPAL
ncbi:sodium-dependent proline transporter-like isoform X2 [Ornithodoros turicata]|uniref:sodium-dependent proline transporter-like isoform X2 n=1 Tax=Ornithodoros turicata TaxID=34597 RepID=UPI003138B35D